ncbi:hypothetical protein CAGGBEG34_860002 [Candidatus Glomeribacter gigasporarum BEG34]|uniref:Uncharacterized protein n=1 Tax=Candidatus Glomeribacter gigasporarum BEG34 TaxID=1070319 RepID=G2JC26_9BURK|nr:hypothetical protein [Candidatus Glomeribacter gigasporarum]CCD30332.1 hypothetical protein CAGGBEG34_860002 [Candidatus Glomeribacter gigasporarum BEG34]
MPTTLELTERINEKISQISDQIRQISGGCKNSIEDQKSQKYIQNEFQVLKDILKIVSDHEILNSVYQVFEQIHRAALNVKNLSPHKVNEQTQELQELQEKFNQEIFNLIQKSISGEPKGSFAQFS